MYESKSFTEMFSPKFDVAALAAVQRRNLDTFNAIGARLAAGAQAYLKRQSEILQVHINDQVAAAKDVFSTSDAQSGLQKQLSFAQDQTKKAFADTQELASIVQTTANEALEILRQHTEAGVTDLNGGSHH
jgi:phasin family protein